LMQVTSAQQAMQGSRQARALMRVTAGASINCGFTAAGTGCGVHVGCEHRCTVHGGRQR
jgi:hypothetical protein